MTGYYRASAPEGSGGGHTRGNANSVACYFAGRYSEGVGGGVPIQRQENRIVDVQATLNIESDLIAGLSGSPSVLMKARSSCIKRSFAMRTCKTLTSTKCDASQFDVHFCYSKK